MTDADHATRSRALSRAERPGAAPHPARLPLRDVMPPVVGTAPAPAA